MGIKYTSLKVLFLQMNLILNCIKNYSTYSSFYLKTLFSFFILLCTSNLFGFYFPDSTEAYVESNYLRYDDFVYNDNIHSVLFYNTKNELSYPIISLGTNEKLKLSFDDFDTDLKSYYYTFIHCNVNWTSSDLIASQYLSNYLEDDIREYKYSFNTDVSFIHYNITFPNENMNIKLSGNYILKVYDINNPDEPVITKRFLVYDNQTSIEITPKNSVDAANRFYQQEIDFTVNHSNLQINNPYQNIHIILMQNYRWDNAITGLKPKYINGSLLDYNYEGVNVFDGNNEYRNFDIKSMNFNSINIYRMEYNTEDQLMHVYLYNEEARSYKKYLSQPDLNGNFLIKRDGSTDSETDANYVKVHFTLKYDQALEDGNLYIFGKFTDWKFNERFKMKYDEKNKCYQQEVLLKQGYYNYMYCFVKDGSKNTGDLSVVEGTHYETDNDYSVLVYYRNPINNFDELIGISTVNSNP